MNIFLGLTKFFFTLLAIVFYFFVTTPLFLFMIFFPFKTKKLLSYLVHILSKVILFILNIDIELNFYTKDLKDKNYFIAANHLSYLDILVISSKIPTNFITSIEVRQTPFLGQIAMLAGCIFVERRNKKNILNEIKEIELALENNLNITIFPEATSTNGAGILPFKRPLFNAAINTNKDILPLTINYLSINGNKVDLSNRDSLFWYGDMGFIGHLYNLCFCRNIKVNLRNSNLLNYNKDNLSSLEELKDLAYLNISKQFIPII